MKTLKYSNIGCRETNQDYLVSIILEQDRSIHLVADGMGGYECGDIASKIVGDSFVCGLRRNLSIKETSQEASKKIQKECKNLGVSKMGSTVAGVFLDKMQACIFWAGDSRVYIFRNGMQIFQTEDHSVVSELSKNRILSYKERERFGHIVTRAIMGNDDDCVDIHNESLKTDDEILICTDGLYNDCPVDYLMETIRDNRFDIDRQNDGFTDNHSFIYIKI